MQLSNCAKKQVAIIEAPLVALQQLMCYTSLVRAPVSLKSHHQVLKTVGGPWGFLGVNLW